MADSQRQTEDASWTALTAGGVGGGLTARQTEMLSLVFACVDVISSALAALPARIYGKEGADRGIDIASDLVAALPVQHIQEGLAGNVAPQILAEQLQALGLLHIRSTRRMRSNDDIR